MTPKKFTTFDEFTRTVREIGFLPGGFPWSDGGRLSVSTLASPDVKWHSGISDLDPWEWRIRVLTDCEDIAYGKLFSGKSGYITREWYPRFIAARRRAESLDEAWEAGKISRPAKRIYDVLRDVPALSVFGLRVSAGLSKEKRSVFERAIVELEMSLYITYCGEAQKISRTGEPYGWPGAVLCTSESFFPGAEDEAAELDPARAVQDIAERVREVLPDVRDRDIRTLIRAAK